MSANKTAGRVLTLLFGHQITATITLTVLWLAVPAWLKVHDRLPAAPLPPEYQKSGGRRAEYVEVTAVEAPPAGEGRVVFEADVKFDLGSTTKPRYATVPFSLKQGDIVTIRASGEVRWQIRDSGPKTLVTFASPKGMDFTPRTSDDSWRLKRALFRAPDLPAAALMGAIGKKGERLHIEYVEGTPHFYVGEAGGHQDGPHRSSGFHRRVALLMPRNLVQEALTATRDAVEDQRSGRKSLRSGVGAYFAGTVRRIAEREGIDLGVGWTTMSAP